ncbi:MAG: hypothetical protein WD904_14315 [Dehalococcoidia bacterium]
MGILDKILGHDEPVAEVPPVDDAPCPHTALAQHWDSLDEMGKAELATYRCESCSLEFSYQEARQYLEEPPAVLASTPES